MEVQQSVFISYRRKESLREARGLFERLSRDLGSGRVFIDLEGIEPGEDFVSLLERQLDGCAVMLVLIGPDWTSASGRDGSRRIDDKNDFVRIEVAAALRRGIRVIPVRFDGAEMPTADELPDDLKPIVRRQSVPLDFNRFNTDVWPLLEAIRRILDPKSAPAKAPESNTSRDAGLPTPQSLTSDSGTTSKERTSSPSKGRRGYLPGNAEDKQRRLRLGFQGLVACGLVGLIVTSVVPQILGPGESYYAVHQASVQSQRLAKSVSEAVLGTSKAFAEVKDSADILVRIVRGLNTGEGDVASVPIRFRSEAEALLPFVDRAEKNAAAVLAQQKVLTQVGEALRSINRQSSDLLEIAETVSSLKLQQGAGPSEISAVGQLVMLTQRIGKSANEFLTMEGVSPEAVFLLGKDLNSFKEIATGLADGNSELRLPGTRDALTKERLAALLKQYEATRVQASAILGNLQGLVNAREAQVNIVADSEPLGLALEQLAGDLRGAQSNRWGAVASVLLLLFGLVSLVLPSLRTIVPTKPGAKK